MLGTFTRSYNSTLFKPTIGIFLCFLVSSEASRLLIELSLEYLMRPVALKEEGLFRVSGDSAVMKSLHADFMSGRATEEFLK